MNLRIDKHSDFKHKSSVAESVKSPVSEQTGYTPGPWKFSKNSLLITAPNEVDGFALRLCTLNSSETWFSNEEREANARLIAAAPALLEAAKAAVENMKDAYRALGYSPAQIKLVTKSLRAAIELATKGDS